METNDIRKKLYTEKTKATLISIKKEKLYYESALEGNILIFAIPFHDIQDGIFLPEMEARHLFRWIDL